VIVDGYASQPHYERHLAPIMEQFGTGVLWTKGRARRLDRPVLRRMDQIRRADVVLVASGVDAAWLQHAGVRRLVYVEHGAGQSYPGDLRAALLGSYSGGLGLDHVDLFLCPSEAVADRWRAVYKAPAVAVGCPALDHLHFVKDLRWDPPVERALTVGWTWHWDCTLCPETRSAWAHYTRDLPAIVAELAEQGIRVLGHSHPKAAQQRGPDRQWKTLGVERVDYERLLVEADVLVADNTSALYEFASLGKPVVVLNAPWYRREVEHGLRFWSHIPGIQVDHPDDLAQAVTVALAGAADRTEVAMRRRVVAHVYAFTDGRAAERAADAIRMLVEADT